MVYLRRVLLALAAVLALAIVAWFGGLGPWGPFAGGLLWGERAAALPDNWSFTDRVAEVEVETWWGPLPLSVTTWCIAHHGTLYIPSRNCTGKRWVRRMLANPDVRVRIDGVLHPLRAVRVEDEALGQAVLPLLLEKYVGVVAEDPRPVTAAEDGAARATGCLFRMDPRS